MDSPIFLQSSTPKKPVNLNFTNPETTYCDIF